MCARLHCNHNIWIYGSENTAAGECKTGKAKALNRVGSMKSRVDLCAYRAMLGAYVNVSAYNEQRKHIYLISLAANKRRRRRLPVHISLLQQQREKKLGIFSVGIFCAFFPHSLLCLTACDVCWLLKMISLEIFIFLHTVEMQNKNEERFSFLFWVCYIVIAYHKDMYLYSFLHKTTWYTAECWWHRWHSAVLQTENIWRWSRWRCMALIWRRWHYVFFFRCAFATCTRFLWHTHEKHPAKRIHKKKFKNDDWTGPERKKK